MFIKMLKDTMLKVQEHNAVYAGKASDDDMRNKEQHEDKGACNHHNMRNPSWHLHVMILAYHP